MELQCVIFDLDGVIVSTDAQHYSAWKKLADEEGIYFDETINLRLRGVSRAESLEIILERAEKTYSQQEKEEMAERKNNYYKELIKKITPDDVLAGVKTFLNDLKGAGIKRAIGSSSKNTVPILKNIGLYDEFDFIADGTMITRSKPFPDVFLLAAKGAGVSADNCLVVEDADSGVQAGKSAGMKVLAVSTAKDNVKADFSAENLTKVTAKEIIEKF